MLRMVLGYLLVATALLMPPPAAEARRPVVSDLDAIYDFYLGGIWSGELSVDAVFDGETYKAEAYLRTAGLVGFFFKARFDAQAKGRIGEAGLTPVHFAASSRDHKRQRRVEISFANGKPVSLLAEPEPKRRPWSILPREQAGAADPLSAGLSAFIPGAADTLCDQRVDIYDGERRFALEIGAPERKGGRIVCPALYVRIAGFKPKMMKPDRAIRPFKLVFERRSDEIFHLVRAVGETAFGLAIMQLRE